MYLFFVNICYRIIFCLYFMNNALENAGHIGVFVDAWGINRVLRVGNSSPSRLDAEFEGVWHTMYGSILRVQEAGVERRYFCSGQGKRVYELGKRQDSDGGYEILETQWYLDNPPTGI